MLLGIRPSMSMAPINKRHYYSIRNSYLEFYGYQYYLLLNLNYGVSQLDFTKSLTTFYKNQCYFYLVQPKFIAFFFYTYLIV